MGNIIVQKQKEPKPHIFRTSKRIMLESETVFALFTGIIQFVIYCPM